MLCLGKQTRELCTPGKQAVAVRQVVKMLSYWEMGVKIQLRCQSLRGKNERGRGGITLAEA